MPSYPADQGGDYPPVQAGPSPVERCRHESFGVHLDPVNEDESRRIKLTTRSDWMSGMGTATSGLRTWAQDHPMRAAGRLLIILLAAAWGGATGAFVAWGPLMAGLPVMVLLGILGAAGHGGLWLRQQAAAVKGERRKARRWLRRLLLGHLGIFLAVGLVSGVQLYRIGFFPPLSQDRLANFDRLVQGMEIAYPYFDLKVVDWEDLVSGYRARISEAQTDEAYFATLEEMLAELNDGHTGVTPPVARNAGCTFVQTREIEGQAVVVRTAGNALDAGLAVGSTILSVDGWPLEETLENINELLRYGSTARQRRARGFQWLLHTPYGEEREVTFETPEGQERKALLVCAEDPAAAAEAGRGGDIWDFLLPVAEPRIVSRRLESGVGYIRVPTFGVDLVDEFDAALNELLDAPGLIIDLRGNGGGNSAYGDQMAGRLMEEPFAYGRDKYAARLPTRAWRAHMTFRVAPREPVYGGPVVVIMETANFSSAEQFLISLMDSGRVQTVGRPTAGGSGNPTVFQLPGARDVRFSTARFVRNDGTPIEGRGLHPDVLVSWTVEDFRQGRDPDLEAAERALVGRD